MAKRNWPLVVGGVLTIVFVVLALAGPRFAPQDPLETNLYFRVESGIHMVPVTPFEVAGYPLGTDEAGRDVLSRILWGIRPTLLICVVVALARLALGITIGVVAGWFRGTTERVVDAVSSVGIGLPPLVLAIALIFVLGVERGAVTFVLTLTLVGWIEVANLIKAQTLTVVQAPYVESARALGVGSWGVVRRHLLPQLRPLVPVLLAFELSAALLLLTELGFLGVYIGGGMSYEADAGGNYQSGPIVLTSQYPEIAQQISRFWTKFYRVPWEFLAVGALIFGQIVAFNLVGEGLRRRLDVTQPRPRRWLHVPDAVLDRVPQPSWRWLPVGTVVAALLVGAWVYTRPRAALPADQLQAAAGTQVGTNAAPSIPTFSDDPLPAEQLGTVDLEALMAQPGLLPQNMTIAHVSKRVPDQFRDMPAPIQVRNFTVKESGVNAGNIFVVVHPSTEERDRAVQTMQAAAAARFVPFGDAGSGTAVFSGSSMVVRCGAVVEVRLVGTEGTAPQAKATALAQALEAQLAPLVCPPEEVQAGTNAAPSVAGQPTAPLPAEQLRAVDLEALMTQPNVLPPNYSAGPFSKRVPDQLRDVPEPVQVRNATLKHQGLNAGNIVVLLYGSIAERDQALQTGADLIANQNGFGVIEGASPPPPQPDTTPVAGERSFTFGLLPPGVTFTGDVPLYQGEQQVIFARCGAVVHVRVSGGQGFTLSDKLDESLAAIIRSLDEHLTPLVCQ